MADIEKLVEELSKLTVLEAADRAKAVEEKWGVSAAAAVAAADTLTFTNAAAAAAAAAGSLSGIAASSRAAVRCIPCCCLELPNSAPPVLHMTVNKGLQETKQKSQRLKLM